MFLIHIALALKIKNTSFKEIAIFSLVRGITHKVHAPVTPCPLAIMFLLFLRLLCLQILHQNTNQKQLAKYFAESGDENKHDRCINPESSAEKREDKGQHYSYPNVCPDKFKKIMIHVHTRPSECTSDSLSADKVSAG